jgi:hypothetical protein
LLKGKHWHRRTQLALQARLIMTSLNKANLELQQKVASMVKVKIHRQQHKNSLVLGTVVWTFHEEPQHMLFV